MDSILRTLAGKRSGDIREIEPALNSSCSKTAFSNPFYSIYKCSGDQGMFSEVEVRTPTKDTKSKECLIIFQMRKDNPYTRSAVATRYKDRVTIVPPRPGQKDMQVTYYKVEDKNFSLSFGYQNDEEQCSEVILAYDLVVSLEEQKR